MVVLVRHRSGDIMLSCNILDMAVFFLFEYFFFPGHRCGGGVLLEALVRETLGHSGWSRATHILQQEHFQIYYMHIYQPSIIQGCINCAILPSGMGAREVSSEHMENMEMFSCSPT